MHRLRDKEQRTRIQMIDCLQMGCLSSRTSSVKPVLSTDDHVSEQEQKGRSKSGSGSRMSAKKIVKEEIVDIGTNLDKDVDDKQSETINPLNGDNPTLSMMAEQDKDTEQEDEPKRRKRDPNIDKRVMEESFDEGGSSSPGIKSDIIEQKNVSGKQQDESHDVSQRNDSTQSSNKQQGSRENSFDEELNMDLLKQYIAVDYEITQLEDKDALRMYHEKIEQLEQLERELDMISSEAEEVAARNEMDVSQVDRILSPNAREVVHQSDSRADSNSVVSVITGSISPKSSIVQRRGQSQKQLTAKSLKNQTVGNNSKQVNRSMTSQNNGENQEQTVDNVRSNNITSAAYSTVEEVFNRKIILEKERDNLKKEVELIIIECDKLQQKYKKRDEILDKLFDGRTGNGLENHLEQQLSWLMEQKHYVDQVFYAWKRAETLTSQTCEQFAIALELLKRLTKLEADDQRRELSNNIAQLLIKSQQNMEQAQSYNPNVDAPFFTDSETERFKKIIETISQPQPLSQGEYSQIATVIQFAYKRAVSIRLWLEQILQITIARDSFELAEEYKWTAIQLRKERITLINSKLQEQPYRHLAQSIREQMPRQQHQSQLANSGKGANMIAGTMGNKSEVNRDSGVESDDIDIEEEIYRLLEMNKSRLEAAIAMQQSHSTSKNSPSNLLANGNNGARSVETPDNLRQGEEIVHERIQNRLQGVPASLWNNNQRPKEITSEHDSMRSTTQSAATITSMPTPTKLRVELDEASRQNLLKQVDQIHVKHQSRLESLRGNNKEKASNVISNRLQQVRNPRSKAEG